MATHTQTLSAADIEAAKTEAQRQLREAERSVDEAEQILAQCESTVALLPTGPQRAQAVKIRDVARDHLRTAHSEAQRLQRVLAGLDDQLRVARQREKAAREVDERTHQVESRLTAADLFERMADQMEALLGTIGEIIDTGQEVKYLPAIVGGIAGHGEACIHWLRTQAEAERRTFGGAGS